MLKNRVIQQTIDLKGFGKERLYFEQAYYLAQKIPMTHIARPVHGSHSPAVLNWVEEHLTSYLPALEIYIQKDYVSF